MEQTVCFGCEQIVLVQRPSTIWRETVQNNAAIAMITWINYLLPGLELLEHVVYLGRRLTIHDVPDVPIRD